MHACSESFGIEHDRPAKWEVTRVSVGYMIQPADHGTPLSQESHELKPRGCLAVQVFYRLVEPGESTIGPLAIREPERRAEFVCDYRLHQRGTAPGAVFGRRLRGVLCDGAWTPWRDRHRRQPRGLPGSSGRNRRGVGARPRLAGSLRSPSGNRPRSSQTSELMPPPWRPVSRRKLITSVRRIGFTGGLPVHPIIGIITSCAMPSLQTKSRCIGSGHPSVTDFPRVTSRISCAGSGRSL